MNDSKYHNGELSNKIVLIKNLIGVFDYNICFPKQNKVISNPLREHWLFMET